MKGLILGAFVFNALGTL